MEQDVWFGNEIYYQWLKRGVLDGDEAVMKKLMEDLYRHFEGRIGQMLSPCTPEDVEDVLQEILLAVYMGIGRFVCISDEKVPYERQSWLNRIAEHAIADHRRKRRTLIKNKQDAAADEGKPEGENSYVSVCSLEEIVEQQGDFEDGNESGILCSVPSEFMDDLITAVCGLNIGAEELLTFLYHSVVFFLEGDTKKKSRPQETERRLREKTLGQLRDELPEALRNAAGVEVNEALFAPLDRKLESCRSQCYSFDSRKITKSTSYTREKIKNKRP